MTVADAPEPRRSVRPIAATQTRGFLFTDIRGYTEFIERRGAAAASELLGRYRTIVRDAISEHEGAEIRTEGDSFYVVLPSASSAVLCGLSILAAIDAENLVHPDQPIRAGIGIHAGEAIETDQGLVGSAVNIAARLAALARPGEVLVSETVRGLTRSVFPVNYAGRGRHRLKGVAEPQEVYSATPAGTVVLPARSRRLPTPVAAVMGSAVLALVVAGVYVALPAGPAATPVPIATTPLTAVSTIGPTTPALTSPAEASTSPSPTVSPEATGPTVIQIGDINPVHPSYTALAADDYRFNSFRPILVFRIDATWNDRSWYALRAGSDFASLFAGRRGVDFSSWDPDAGIASGLMELDFIRTQTAFGNPCDPGDTTANKLLGGRSRDIIDWLSKQRFLSVSNLQPANVAGYGGLSIDATVTGDPGQVCGGSVVSGQGRVFLFETAPIPAAFWGGLYVIRDGEKAHFTVIDIGGDVPLILVTRTLVAEYQTLFPWSDDLVGTMTVLDE
jgi:class 3 adenylate cyclase